VLKFYFDGFYCLLFKSKTFYFRQCWNKPFYVHVSFLAEMNELGPKLFHCSSLRFSLMVIKLKVSSLVFNYVLSILVYVG
jgi:hypothetical protein